MRTEKIVAAILVVGLILRNFHIPGGTILTVLPMTLLALLYFPFGFYFLSDKKIDGKTVGFSIVSGLLLSTLVIGCEFKVMHWTGAMMVLIFGLVTCLPIAVASYLNFTKSKEGENAVYFKNIFVRVVTFTIFGLLVMVL
ncbi:hypothetical protein [Flavobacterium phycosphaerae]|uniref:hypothetical protein n=1 Tax=Flavobacterium phycosphaerae TaxID=2697515 RepID=UPI001389AA42|nr:hypothetical protein [Flavobacterium phycosphaerae]